jgi:gliding motility-associated-like protein
MDVRLAVHNNYGCDDTALTTIPLHRISEFIPNAFTPDKDENNRFTPYIQGNVTDVLVWIFNRNGEQVAFFQSPEGYWDGTDQHGRRCAQGTYVYVIRYRNSLDPLSTQELKGTITLIR